MWIVSQLRNYSAAVILLWITNLKVSNISFAKTTVLTDLDSVFVCSKHIYWSGRMFRRLDRFDSGTVNFTSYCSPSEAAEIQSTLQRWTLSLHQMLKPKALPCRKQQMEKQQINILTASIHRQNRRQLRCAILFRNHSFANQQFLCTMTWTRWK